MHAARFQWTHPPRFRDMMGSAELDTMDDLENVAEYSQSSLLYLLLEALGVHGEDIEYAASHVGVCKGIVTLLRGHEVHRVQVSLVLFHCGLYYNLKGFECVFSEPLLFPEGSYAKARTDAFISSEWTRDARGGYRAAGYHS